MKNIVYIISLITISFGIGVKFWPQKGKTCAFMAANNCVQTELFDIKKLCSYDMEILQCKGCWDTFMQKCEQCPKGHEKLTIVPSKVTHLLAEHDYTAIKLQTPDAEHIAEEVKKIGVSCILLNMHGLPINHASAITRISSSLAPTEYWYLDSNSNPKNPKRYEWYKMGENEFFYPKSQRIEKDNLQNWIAEYLRSGIDDAFVVRKRRNSFSKLQSDIDQAHPRIQRRYSVANKEYHDILNNQYTVTHNQHYRKNQQQRQKLQISPHDYIYDNVAKDHGMFGCMLMM